jgi:hypothetical protein
VLRPLKALSAFLYRYRQSVWVLLCGAAYVAVILFVAGYVLTRPRPGPRVQVLEVEGTPKNAAGFQIRWP